MKIAQRSFAAGEVAPALYARTDLSFYGQALRTLRNAYVMRTGGIQSRPGTVYKGTTKSNGQARLIPCVFADDQNYVLEFGNLYVRFWKNGSPITATVTGAWADATVYAAGVVVSYSGTNYVCLLAHTSATATNRPSTGSSWTTYWAALSGATYELPTPYTTAQLSALQFAQTPGILTIVHPSHAPAQLQRFADNQWDLFDINFNVPGNILPPTGLTAGPDASGVSTWTTATAYTVNTLVAYGAGVMYRCILAHTSGASSEPGVGASWTTYWAIKGTGGDNNGFWYVITSVNAGGVESAASAVIKTDSSQTSLSPTWRNLYISWSAASGATAYRVYRSLASTTGYRQIATVTTTSAVDTNPMSSAYISTSGPPAPEYVFSGTGEYPSSVAFYQQRLLLAGSTNDPDTTYASVTGSPYDFNTRYPIQDDDAIEWRQLAKQAVQVRHLLDIANRLLVFTNIGEYVILGGSDGVLRPGEINPTIFSYNGANSLDPLTIESSALYVQARGSKVLQMSVGQQGGAMGSDLSLTATHFLDGYQLVSWAYQEIPYSTAWIVRSDGKMLSLSYVPEAGIVGWASHDTDGAYESVCCVPEGGEDAVYVIVNRTISASTVRYIERLSNRITSGTKVLSDAAKSWSVLSTGANASMVFPSVVFDPVTNTTYANAVTSPTAAFSASDVGSSIALFISGSWQTWVIDSFISSSEVLIGRSGSHTLPASVTRENWAYILGGLSHLNGKAVSIANNGVVLASPNNPAYATATVSSGSLPNTRYGYTGSTSNFVVGLPYMVDVETLDIDQSRGSIKNDNVRIGAVSVWIQDSGSFYIGPKSVSGTGLTGLELYTPSNDEGYALTAGQTFTGVAPVTLQSTYTKNGRIFIRQPDAVPLTILAVVPEGLINGRG